MKRKCLICDADLRIGMRRWHFFCNNCCYEKAELTSEINTSSNHHLLINENLREEGLRSLRRHNFRELLQKISKFHTAGAKRLLDVGAAHGWFLEQASIDYDVLGIEPDIAIYEVAKEKGLPVRLGYFPEVLKGGEIFDIIIFNDVFEHILDLNSVLHACYAHLSEDGILVLNMPSSKGFFYRTSKMFGTLGVLAYFDRLWQKGMPSPHLHYFNADNLNKLVCRIGFSEVYRGSLPSLRLKGLYYRITYVRKIGKISKCILYLLILLILPMLSWLPKDIMYSIYRRK